MAEYYEKNLVENCTRLYLKNGIIVIFKSYKTKGSIVVFPLSTDKEWNERYCESKTFPRSGTYTIHRSFISEVLM